MRTVRFLWVFQAVVFVLVCSLEATAQDPLAPPQTGAGAGASKVFNPDISVIGDFVGVAGKNDVSPSPAMEMHESEVAFQAIVDPYAKADFFISFGEEGVELEEGYITFPALPGGLSLKVGKMRAAFGKVNTLHNHVLPWAERPLVTNNLVGGEDGIDDSGFSLSPRLFQIGGASLEATIQAFRGDSSTLFKTSEHRDLTYVGHLRGYADLSESTNVDLGFSLARGHNDAGIVSGVDVGRFRTTLIGADVAVKWRPLSRSIYRGFAARSEVVWSQRGDFGGREDAMGFYVSGEYLMARRWSVGGRYDNSETASNPAIRDTGQSAIVTYRPSEFSLVRAQYRRTDYGVGSVAHEVLAQFLFSIGAHGAHPFF